MGPTCRQGVPRRHSAGAGGRRPVRPASTHPQRTRLADHRLSLPGRSIAAASPAAPV